MPWSRCAAATTGTRCRVTDGVTAVFHDAGHILGSAIVELRVADGGEVRTIVFSGDLGRDGTPILRDPTPISHAEYVVVESTYGNREHAPHDVAIEELAAAVGEVAADDGVMLIPAFAIGRTQELIWVLDDLVRDGRIPRVPLYLDSPMASKATQVYYDHPESYDEETNALVRSGDSPLKYPGQQFTDSVEESKAIRYANRPIMVVASSGMLTGGRVMHHLKDFLPDPTCTLLFIGYQGEGTLGRHLQDGGDLGADRRGGDRRALPGPLHLRLQRSRRPARARGVAGALRTGRAGNGTGVRRRSSSSMATPTRPRPSRPASAPELGMQAHVPAHRETVSLG